MDSLPPNANVPGGRAFGDRGELVFSAEFDFGSAHELSHLTAFNGTASISPSLETFILHRVSLGAAFGVTYETGDGAHAWDFSSWPRLGVVFPCSRDLVFWPRAGVELTTGSITAGNVTSRSDAVAVALYAPLALLPLPHIAIGFGPTFFADIARHESGGAYAPRGTTFGLAVDIGGYM